MDPAGPGGGSPESQNPTEHVGATHNRPPKRRGEDTQKSFEQNLRKWHESVKSVYKSSKNEGYNRLYDLLSPDKMNTSLLDDLIMAGSYIDHGAQHGFGPDLCMTIKRHIEDATVSANKMQTLLHQAVCTFHVYCNYSNSTSVSQSSFERV